MKVIDTRRNGTPSLKLYFAVIDAIERALDRAEQRHNRAWSARQAFRHRMDAGQVQ